MDGWTRLVEALGPHAARLGLRPGATPDQLAAAERTFGFALPDDYRRWLAIADGQAPGALSILPTGGRLAPLAWVVAQWQSERPYDLDDPDAVTETQDRSRVRWFVFHPRRIAIGGTIDGDGDPTVLDLVPGPAGTVGQVLDAVTECDFVVIGASLSAYFDRVAALVERGRLVARTVDVFGEPSDTLAAPDHDGRWEGLVRGDRRRR